MTRTALTRTGLTLTGLAAGAAAAAWLRLHRDLQRAFAGRWTDRHAAGGVLIPGPWPERPAPAAPTRAQLEQVFGPGDVADLAHFLAGRGEPARPAGRPA